MRKTFYYLKWIGGILASLLIVYACAQEELSDPKKPTKVEPLTTASAKQWYYANFGVRPETKSETGVPDRPQLNPEWGMSTLYTDSMWYAIESPLSVEDSKHLRVMTSSVSAYADSKGDKSLARNVFRTVVLRHKVTGETYAFNMVVVPELDYMLSKGDELEKNTYLTRESDLDGMVVFYHIDGHMLNGWMYRNGKIVGGFNPNYTPKIMPRRVIYVDVHYCWYQEIYIGGAMINSGFYCETSTGILFTDEKIMDNLLEMGGAVGGADLGGSTNPGKGEPEKEKEKERDKDEEPKDPCANLKGKTSSSEFNAMLKELGDLTKGNYEAGRTYTYRNGVYEFTTYTGNAGSPEVTFEIPYGVKIDGIMHTHYDGLLPVFSAADMLAPYDLYTQNSINNLEGFTSGLVTSEGVYFMSVTDAEKYKKFGKFYLENIHILESAIERIYGITPNLSADEAYQRFAKLLNLSDVGVSLMRKEGTGYNKVEIDKNNKVKETNCN